MTTREASVAKIAEVLARHRVVLSYGTDTVHCACGAVSASREQHVAEALASAGIGYAGAIEYKDADEAITAAEKAPDGWVSIEAFRATLGRAFGAKE